MKVFLTVLLLISAHTFCSSQNAHFAKGHIVLQPGIGFISTLGSSTDEGIGITTPLKVPPVSLVSDVGITESVSLGGYIATASSDVFYEDFAQRVKLGTLKHFVVGVRGLYHFELTEKLDTYGGAMLGYNAISAKGFDDSEGTAAGFTYTLLAGARYPFTPQIGAFLELGYGVSAINVGLSIRIK